MVHLKIIQIEKEHHLNQASIFFLFQNVRFQACTPLKTNISSEDQWFGRCDSFLKDGPFLWVGFMSIFGGCILPETNIAHENPHLSW